MECEKRQINTTYTPRPAARFRPVRPTRLPPLQDNLYLVIISGIASLIHLDYWYFFFVLAHQGVVSTVYDEKVCGENIEGIELSVSIPFCYFFFFKWKKRSLILFFKQKGISQELWSNILVIDLVMYDRICHLVHQLPFYFVADHQKCLFLIIEMCS